MRYQDVARRMRSEGRARGARGGTVAVVGLDGSGQSTHARALTIWLRERGYESITVPFHRYLFLRTKPSGADDLESKGGRREGNPMRPILSLVDNLLLLFLSAIRLRIEGRVIVYDRYIWSTYLKYEVLGYPVRPLSWLYLVHRPTVCVLLDVPVSKSLEVIAQRPKHIKYRPDVLTKEREHLLKIATSRRCKVVDAAGSFSEVQAEIENEISDAFPARKLRQKQLAGLIPIDPN